MFKCTKYKEPPYAERHVRWCERSVNESRDLILILGKPAAERDLIGNDETIDKVFGDDKNKNRKDNAIPVKGKPCPSCTRLLLKASGWIGGSDFF